TVIYTLSLHDALPILKCGGMKVGAWTICPECKHTPDDLEDQAKHLMASDHYFSQADLELISTRVQSGQPLHFNDENVAELVGMRSEEHTSELQSRFDL